MSQNVSILLLSVVQQIKLLSVNKREKIHQKLRSERKLTVSALGGTLFSPEGRCTVQVSFAWLMECEVWDVSMLYGQLHLTLTDESSRRQCVWSKKGTALSIYGPNYSTTRGDFSIISTWCTASGLHYSSRGCSLPRNVAGVGEVFHHLLLTLVTSFDWKELARPHTVIKMSSTQMIRKQTHFSILYDPCMTSTLATGIS